MLYMYLETLVANFTYADISNIGLQNINIDRYWSIEYLQVLVYPPKVCALTASDLADQVILYRSVFEA